MIFACTGGVAVRGLLPRLCACDPVLPWVYTIARRVRVDNYRKLIRISSRGTGVDVFPEVPTRKDETRSQPREAMRWTISA
jgi:DNA-directed RNA polymerase specialized sigma24 family protein